MHPSNKLKILIISNYGYISGGVETTLSEVVPYLKQRGHSVKILTSDVVVANKQSFNDISFKALPRNGIKKIIYTAFNFNAYKITKSTLKQFEPDIVMIHSTYHATAAVLSLLKNYPTLMYVHGPELYIKEWTKWYVARKHFRDNSGKLHSLTLLGWVHFCYFRLVCAPLYRLWINNVTLFVALSHFTQSTLAKQYISAKYIPNGVKLFHPKGTINKIKEILYVGRLESYKGVDDLLNAIAIVQHDIKDIHLTIVGEGSDKDRLIGIVESLQINNNVKFLPFQNRDKLQAIYAASTIVVMPSAYPETFGKVGVEAMSAGRPVVACDVGGVTDWLRHGVNGLLVSEHRPDQIANALISILEDRRRLETMSYNALKTAETYSIDKLSANFERLCYEAISTKDRAG